MKAIRTWRDMEQYGITCLTGEACAYGYRLLCDVNMAGLELIKQAFDFAKFPTDMLRPEWNRGCGSIMLARPMLEPLAVMALMQAGCSKVYVGNSEVWGVEASDDADQLDAFERAHSAEISVYHNPGYARNQHQFTGRKV